ncbi:hypothetical protein PITCH_A720013 [uncultured Desulfobacterium sp.]|uniref:TubC N-terminal docking domain-containing protein n=1 Tax=uncultured Desulfobacterium sp. TaxID=201089 RepID=A0A445N1U8_9BACT|nr:hypothetical protein PITCH_A720013 [uncultured Desulfobacterium sp.]
MDTVKKILNECKARGIEIRADGPHLRCKPRSLLDDNLSDAIRRNKEAILQMLDPDVLHKRIYNQIQEFNRLGISLMDFPEATRHRAFEIEQRITEVVNSGDVASFDQCLTEWRRCFH